MDGIVPPEQPDQSTKPRPVLLGTLLGGIAFVALLLLLFGAARLLDPAPPGAAPTISGVVPSAVVGPDSSPVLVGAGDIADCSTGGPEATATLLDGVVGIVFTAGDNAYPSGSTEQFANCYHPTWGRHLERTWPAPGNHDWETDQLAGYLGYFGTRAAPHGDPWYSYDLGSWHVVVLVSDCPQVGGCEPESEQGRWLADDLATSSARCTVAIFHHPRFSSGNHAGTIEVGPFWDALYAAGAEIVIAGHDHHYERFAPQDPLGRADLARGIRQFVVGTGGATLVSFARQAPNSEAATADTHGVLKLTLDEDSYDWEFLATSGGFTDRGSGPCH